MDSRGLEDEQVVLELLNAYPEPRNKYQLQGIDGYLPDGLTVDVKSTRKWRKTFSVELYSHDRNGKGYEGWMYDTRNVTDMLALATLDYDRHYFEIILVDKKELRNYMFGLVPDKRMLRAVKGMYEQQIPQMQVGPSAKVVISYQLTSTPANLILPKDVYLGLPGTQFYEGSF